MWKVKRKINKAQSIPASSSTSSSLSMPLKSASPLQAVINAKQANTFSFFDSVKPVVRTARFFGLLPFTLNYTSHGEIDCSIRIIDAIWFMTSVAMCIIFSVLGYLALTPTQDSRTTILLLGGRIILISGVSLAAISIVMDFFNRHRLVELVKAINSFDKEMTTFAVYIDYEREYKFVRRLYRYTFFTTFFATIFIYCLYTWLYENETSFNIFVYLVANSITYGQAGSVFKQYIILLLCLRSRFKFINALMRKHFLDVRNTIITIESNKSMHIDLLRSMTRVHDNLTDVVENVNICYSFQIMINIGLCLSTVVLALYTVYRYITVKNELTKQLTYVNFLASSIYVVYCISIINIASSLMKEGKEASRIIHKSMNKIENEALKQRFFQFSQQLQHRYPIISCRLFIINWTVLYSIIGTVATYLTILVQFDTPIKHKTRSST